MQTEGNSYLVSIDLQSGDIAWKTDRNIETQKESGDSYTTPHVVKVDGVETIISFGADHITGHDAKSGKLVWTSAGINPDNKGMWRAIASSVYTDGVVVVPHGRGDFLMGLKAGGQGDVTKSNVLWRKKYSCTDAATPVAHDGKVYLLIDRGKNRGVINCIDAKSGKELWSGKLPKSASTYYASPIMIGDTFCAPREDGTVVMAKIKRDGLGEVVENKLGQSFIASPIAVDGKLILRGDTFLWCVK
jgi:outer membrane protein assembly factor BamB